MGGKREAAGFWLISLGAPGAAGGVFPARPPGAAGEVGRWITRSARSQILARL